MATNMLQCPGCGAPNPQNRVTCYACSSDLNATVAMPPPAGLPAYHPQPAGQSADKPSQMAVIALLAGIGSVVMVALAIPAIIVGAIELKNIKKGASPPAGTTYAKVGMWLGIGCIIFYVVVGVGALALNLWMLSRAFK